MMPAILTDLPPEKIAVRCEGVGARRGEAKAEPSFDFALDPIEATIVDGVFEPGMRPVLAIAIVPLHRHDGVADGDDVVRLDEADDVRKARIGGGRLIGPPHAAA